jgi:hypothetical protein
MTIVALTPRGDYAADRVAAWGIAALASQPFSRHDAAAITIPAIRTAASTATTVLYFGHGREDSWIECSAAGFDSPVVVRSILGIPDASALGSTVVLAFACLSADQLGPHAIAAGVRRFIGFRKTLFWYPQSKRAEDALRLVLRDMVEITLRQGAAVTLKQLSAPIVERERYFRDLSSRGDGEAVSVAGTLAIIADSLTLH